MSDLTSKSAFVEATLLTMRSLNADENTVFNQLIMKSDHPDFKVEAGPAATLLEYGLQDHDGELTVPAREAMQGVRQGNLTICEPEEVTPKMRNALKQATPEVRMALQSIQRLNEAEIHPWNELLKKAKHPEYIVETGSAITLKGNGLLDKQGNLKEGIQDIVTEVSRGKLSMYPN